MNKKFNILIFVLASFILRSQLPDTDIWLFKIEKNKTDLKLSDPKNITNRPGYDNQPSFSTDSKKIYYVSIREGKQADIYTYEIGSGKTLQFTKTKESEYSPTITPDKKSLACVVVLEDSSQIIFPLDLATGKGSEYPTSKFEMSQISAIDSIGYFTFLNADTVLYYKLTQPHSLNAYCISTGKNTWLGNNPIRAFKNLNRHAFIYGIKDSTKVTFYKYDLVLQKAEKYCDYASTNEDAIWHEQHGLVKSEGNKLLRYDEAKKEWIRLFDLSTFGIKKITRFNFDPKNKYLVVVDNL
ncbi:MAG: PD40 domain-containing protein [Bacteroidetes bacterium]|nr:PD40 domain-containing protein [Bacteroidota bacterium]